MDGRAKRKQSGNKRLGSWGEGAARRYLEAQGAQVLESNVRTAYGEIDLLAKEDGTLLFCEVKTRHTQTFGYPEESVTPKKQEHMRNSALDYLQSHEVLDADWRIDVISVERPPDQQVKVTWFKHALSG
jgi:putative endonuclease